LRRQGRPGGHDVCDLGVHDAIPPPAGQTRAQRLTRSARSIVGGTGAAIVLLRRVVVARTPGSARLLVAGGARRSGAAVATRARLALARLRGCGARLGVLLGVLLEPR